MNTIRTGQATRIKLAATAVALAGLTLVLTGCGGGAGHDKTGEASGESNGSSVGGTYVDTTEGQRGDVVIIDGNKITYLSLHASPRRICALLNKTFTDIDGGKLAPSGNSDEDRYEVESAGTINENKTTVLWDDDNGTFTGKQPGPGAIKVEPDMITLEHVFDRHAKDDVLVPRDSDLGRAVVSKYCR